MEHKIGIVGCSGTGKSVFAEALAVRLGIPFLASKDITCDILRRDGYDYASGEQVEKFLATPERQQELLVRTVEQQSVPAFVTDRTGIDLGAYAILEMEGPMNVKRYLDECRKLCENYTLLIMCPWLDREIINNQRRTLDPWYQFAVDATQRQAARMFDCKMLTVSTEETEQRLEFADDFIEIRELMAPFNDNAE